MENRTSELLSFIGINTGLISDFIKIFNPEKPDPDTLAELLYLYQENEEYRNELESLMAKENLTLSLDLIELKQKYEPYHL